MLFFIFSEGFSSWLQLPSSNVAFNGRRVCHGVVWSTLETYLFFRPKSPNGFSVKLISGMSFNFLYFVPNHGSSNLRPQDIAIPLSVTMVRPAETSQK